MEYTTKGSKLDFFSPCYKIVFMKHFSIFNAFSQGILTQVSEDDPGVRIETEVEGRRLWLKTSSTDFLRIAYFSEHKIVISIHHGTKAVGSMGSSPSKTALRA